MQNIYYSKKYILHYLEICLYESMYKQKGGI